MRKNMEKVIRNSKNGITMKQQNRVSPQASLTEFTKDVEKKLDEPESVSLSIAGYAIGGTQVLKTPER
jgi:hypothetical protein